MLGLFIAEWLLVFSAATALYIGTVRAGVGPKRLWRWAHWSFSYPLVVVMMGRTFFESILKNHTSPGPEEFGVLGIFGCAVVVIGFAVQQYVKSNADESEPR